MLSHDSPRRSSRGAAVPAVVPPEAVSDRSVLDSALGFISDVTLTSHQSNPDPKDTIIWARFESAADISDPRFGEDWELEGNVAPPLLLVLGYGLGVQVWAIPANGEAVEVLSWRHGTVSTLRFLPTPSCAPTIDEHDRLIEVADLFADRRPLIALVDSTSSTATSQPQFCAINYISLKTGQQVKAIKFKNPVLDVLANRSSIVITFHERIAIFDALTLEDRLSVTTCFPSPGINPNPVALGPRWLAYAEQKIIPSKRSGGGWDGEGIASYTATVLNAAKSFGKGLREFGEQVAAGITGATSSSSASKGSSFDAGTGMEGKTPGVVTVIDIKHSIKSYSPTTNTPTNSNYMGNDPIVAHFVAHAEAIVSLDFDNSGMLLLTADRRGHDFHVFRIQPHPVGPSMAAVHHLYVLHRGDTSSKVQNVAFTLDSRWVAVSTLRGTTHVFPITPYGGPMGVRTHTSLHVVNKLSRFHRSAGLSAEGRSNSPISHSESTTFVQSLQPYHNPTLPPFPRPTVVLALAQLRQPFTLSSPPGSAGLSLGGKIGSGGGSSSMSQRQRHSSLSDDNGKPLSVCAIFAKSRSWILEPPNTTREAPHRMQRKAVDSLFVMAAHGALIQYDLDTKLSSYVAKEKICDDTAIELEIEAKAQWNLGRRKEGSQEIMPPLTPDNWLMRDRNSCVLADSARHFDDIDDDEDSWLSKVEIVTHAGPHRRLWMGPQFVFKTYNTPSGSNLNHVDMEAVEIGLSKPPSATAALRSNPLTMPGAASGISPFPVLIESGSYSKFKPYVGHASIPMIIETGSCSKFSPFLSYSHERFEAGSCCSIEHSPKFMDRFRHDNSDSDFAVEHGDSRIKQDLAEAMRESPLVAALQQKESGRLSSEGASSDCIPFYDARADYDLDDDESDHDEPTVASFLTFSNMAADPVSDSSNSLPLNSEPEAGGRSRLKSKLSSKPPKPIVEKVVNSFGTVTTVTAGTSIEVKTDILDEVVSQLSAEEGVIHENCDEALFRPVVAIFCDEKTREAAKEEAARVNEEFCKPPEAIGNKLIVPVIAKEVNAALCEKEKQQKSGAKLKQQRQVEKIKDEGKMNETEQCEVPDIFTESRVQPFPLATRGKHQMYEEASAPQLKGKDKTKEAKTFVDLLQDSQIEVDSTVYRSADDETKAITTKNPAKPDRKQQQESVDNTTNSKPTITAKKDSVPKTNSGAKRRTLIEQSISENTTHKLKAISCSKISTNEEVIASASLQRSEIKEEKHEPAVKPQAKTKVSPKTPEIKGKKSPKKEFIPQDNNVIEFKSTMLIPSNKYTRQPPDEIDSVKKEYKEKTVVTSSEKQAKDIKPTCSDTCLKTDTKSTLKDKKGKECDEKETLGKLLNSPKQSGKNKNKDANKVIANDDLEPLQPLELFTSPIEVLSPVAFSKSENNESENATVPERVEKSKALIKYEVSSVIEKNITTISDDLVNNLFEFQTEIDKHEGSGKDSIKGTNVDVKVKTVEETSLDPKKSPAKMKTEEVATRKLKPGKKSPTNVVENKQRSENSALDNDESAKKKLSVSSATANKAIEAFRGKTMINITDIVKSSQSDAEKGNEKETTKKLSLSVPDVVPSTKLQHEYVVKVTEFSAGRDAIIPTEEKSTKKCLPAGDGKVTFSEKIQQRNEHHELPRYGKRFGCEEFLVNLKENFGSHIDLNKDRDFQQLKRYLTSGKRETNTFELNLGSCGSVVRAARLMANILDENDVIISFDGKAVEVKSAVTSCKPGASNFEKPELDPIFNARDSEDFPSLDATFKSKKNTKLMKFAAGKTPTETEEFSNLSPELEILTKSFDTYKKNKKLSATPDIGDLPALQPLGALPPLPTLEPLEGIPKAIAFKAKDTKGSKEISEQLSLINFESPLQENPALERKITPPPRGFSEQNLIMALCGSLHYENEGNSKPPIPRIDNRSVNTSPPHTLGRSRSVLDEQSTAEYKSLTENDDQYMSLEQSSQETNTTNTATTNEKFSSSANSSASEELIVVEEKKMSRKQRRKRQQVELKMQKEGAAAGTLTTTATTQEDDEELRPLISMTDSQLEPVSSEEAATITSSADALVVQTDSVAKSTLAVAPSSPLAQSTTTDSEGPLPATTSDDNVFVFATPTNINKMKTKKLDHKINLIAAIEAATSSSTSSAEESGVEANAGAGVHDAGSDQDVPPLVGVGANSNTTQPMLYNVGLASPSSVTKKKTKRRKR